MVGAFRFCCLVPAVWRLPAFPYAGQLHLGFLGDVIVDRESSWKFILGILLDRYILCEFFLLIPSLTACLVVYSLQFFRFDLA